MTLPQLGQEHDVRHLQLAASLVLLRTCNLSDDDVHACVGRGERLRALERHVTAPPESSETPAARASIKNTDMSLLR